MRSGSPVALLFALVVLAAVPLAGIGGAAGVAQPAVDETTYRVQIQSDGDARFSVIYAFELTTKNESQAFDDLAERFESGELDAYSADTFRRAADNASEATGRNMSVEAVERNAYTRSNSLGDGGAGPLTETETGYIALNFTWTNFAVQQGNTIRVEDGFNASVANSTETGTWLPYLPENQALVIVPPSGYSVDSAPVPVDEAAVRWEGPRTFAPGDIYVVYERGRSTSPGTNTPTTTPDERGLQWAPLIGVGVVLGTLLVLGAYALRRDDDPGGDPPPAATDDADGSDGGSVGGAAAATGTAATADDGGTDPEEDIDPDLLSDEERVERLLRANGGRMKQATIVKETGWSNAKVSQLLSSMDEADRVDKLRIGRENLISLPDKDDFEQ